MKEFKRGDRVYLWGSKNKTGKVIAVNPITLRVLVKWDDGDESKNYPEQLRNKIKKGG